MNDRRTRMLIENIVFLYPRVNKIEISLGSRGNDQMLERDQLGNRSIQLELGLPDHLGSVIDRQLAIRSA